MEKIGRITKEQMITSRKKISRNLELEVNVGWVATHKVHKSQKDYSRKNKNNKYSYED